MKFHVNNWQSSLELKIKTFLGYFSSSTTISQNRILKERFTDSFSSTSLTTRSILKSLRRSLSSSNLIFRNQLFARISWTRRWFHKPLALILFPKERGSVHLGNKSKNNSKKSWRFSSKLCWTKKVTIL